ncbi:MAG: hypothetical protein IAF08_16720 [Rhizobacter sp.]|nr:hypothetical protein [Chlorobiales bacterium]
MADMFKPAGNSERQPTDKRIVPQVDLDNLNEVSARKRLTLLDGDLEKLPLLSVFRLVKVSASNCRLIVTAAEGETLTFDILVGSIQRASSTAYQFSNYLLGTGALTPLDIYETSERSRLVQGRGKFITALIESQKLDFNSIVDHFAQYIRFVFFRSIQLSNGNFRINYDADTDRQVLTVSVDIEPLLKQGAADLTYWKEILNVLKDDDLSLELNPVLPPNVKQITLTAEDWQCLSQFNGRRSLTEVLVMSRLPIDRALISMRKLVANGITRSVEPVHGTELVIFQREPMSPSKSMPADIPSNLIYRKIDGEKSLLAIQQALGMTREEVVERCYLMAKGELISVKDGKNEFRNLVEQIVVMGKKQQ